MLLPSEGFIGDQMPVVDPDAIHKARDALRRDVGRANDRAWRAAYANTRAVGFELTPDAKAARRLRTVALGYIAASGATERYRSGLSRQFETRPTT